jgi:putative SbcD/Mre11-related phosphoesterase
MDKNIQIKDLSLYLRKEKILIIGDIHLGYEEAMISQGVLFPKFQFKETLDRLIKILNELDIKKVVITGDLKHEFGKILKTEWSDILNFLDFLLKKYEVIVLKGNHDPFLEFIAEKRKIILKPYYKINDIFICHGDKILDNLDFYSSKTIIIGHEHPAVSISENNRKETFKCFLVGKYKNKELIVMPSFNVLTEGSDILRNEVLSPFLKQDIDDFEVYAIADKVYKFGKLKNIKK